MVTAKKTVILRNLFSENSPTEREIVEATIAFVNGATIVVDDVPDSLKHLQLVPAPMTPTQRRIAEDSLRGWRKLVHGGKPPETNIRDASEDEGLLQSRFRLVYREFLAKLLHDPRAIPRTFTDMGFLSKLPVETYLHATADGLSIVHHYHLDTFFDATQVGTALLLDQTKDFGRKICQCQLGTCGKFFFEIQPATGRPQRKYCCSDHMTDAHNQNAAKRMKKFRSKPARKHK